VLADAEDTAKVLLSLNLLENGASPEQMSAAFESPSHSRTYAGERNPSFSANYSVLYALLHTPQIGKYSQQICVAAAFLCRSGWEGGAKDKWVSPHWPV
jgi:hypothetical protein